MKKNCHYFTTGILIIVALILIFHIQITNYMINSFHPHIDETEVYDVPYNLDDIKLINFFDVMKARINHPEIHVTGIVYNENLGLNVPIANGVDNTILCLCAATLSPNENIGKGDYTLMAHNPQYSKTTLFSPLYHNAHVGTEIYVTDFKKNYTFQIVSQKTISKEKYSCLSSDKHPTLTLITNSHKNKEKEIYIGKLTSVTDFDNLSQHTKRYLKQKISY